MILTTGCLFVWLCDTCFVDILQSEGHKADLGTILPDIVDLMK
jgi:hypothetical protein